MGDILAYERHCLLLSFLQKLDLVGGGISKHVTAWVVLDYQL